MFYQHSFSGPLKVNTQEKCSASVKYLFQLQHNWKVVLQPGTHRDSLWSYTTVHSLDDIPLWRHIFDGYTDTAFQWRVIIFASAGVQKSWAQFFSLTKSCMMVPSICSTITAVASMYTKMCISLHELSRKLMLKVSVKFTSHYRNVGPQ